MAVLLVAGLALLAWCLLPLPLAVAVGRAFRAGERAQDAEGVTSAL